MTSRTLPTVNASRRSHQRHVAGASFVWNGFNAAAHADSVERRCRSAMGIRCAAEPARRRAGGLRSRPRRPGASHCLSASAAASAPDLSLDLSVLNITGGEFYNWRSHSAARAWHQSHDAARIAREFDDHEDREGIRPRRQVVGSSPCASIASCAWFWYRQARVADGTELKLMAAAAIIGFRCGRSRVTHARAIGAPRFVDRRRKNSVYFCSSLRLGHARGRWRAVLLYERDAGAFHGDVRARSHCDATVRLRGAAHR